MTPRSRSILCTLLFVLLVAGTSFTDESDSIISEWRAAIQIIKTTEFSDWPGVSGTIPSDISMTEGRTWLIWPGCLINLNEFGRPDIHTLLTLFATQTAEWPGGRWSPEGGALDSNGNWTGFSSSRQSVMFLNTRSGEVRRTVWTEGIPDAMYPLPDRFFLTLSGSTASLLRFNEESPPEHRDFDIKVPALTQLAASVRYPAVAWREALDEGIHSVGNTMGISGISERFGLDDMAEALESRRTGRQILFGNPWSMDWAGDYLVLAGPGRLTALRLLDDGNWEMEALEDERLPKRWYRIKGGADRLGILLPESEAIVLVIPEARERLPEQRTDDAGDFSHLLETASLSAGEALETTGEPIAAERFYRWILPYIRRERGMDPLNENWFILEEEVKRRRTAIRDSWD